MQQEIGLYVISVSSYMKSSEWDVGYFVTF